MTAHSKIKAKIAALRKKTTGAGCTEAEAVAAAELAAKLMADHGLSVEEIEMTEASARESTVRATWRSDLAGVIAYCTNTAVILDLTEGTWLFIGKTPGPEVAIYLREVCFRAVNKSIAEFKAGKFYRRRRSLATKREAVASFTSAMVARLSVRLTMLFGPSVSVADRDAAKAVLARRFAKREPMIKPAKVLRFSEAAAEGFMAGNKVALNRGVDGSQSPLAIGRDGQ